LTPEDNIREVNMAMEDRETFSLIGSDKVEGTNVYGADGEKVGYIERVMIDKISGKVSYAVLSFGGLLGIGDDQYPLPWQALKYDANLGGTSRALPGPASRRPQIRRREQLELERPRDRALRECLLWRAGRLRRHDLSEA
jgi:PRC-barrel domain